MNRYNGQAQKLHRRDAENVENNATLISFRLVCAARLGKTGDFFLLMASGILRAKCTRENLQPR